MDQADERKAYKTRADILTTGAISLANDAIKTAGLISGGASVAALGFVAQKMGDPSAQAVAGQLVFLWGALVLSGLAACSAYGTQAYYAKAMDDYARDFGRTDAMIQTEAACAKWKGRACHIVTLILMGACYGCLIYAFWRISSVLLPGR